MAKTLDEIRLDILDDLAEDFKKAAERANTENNPAGWVTPAEVAGLWRAYHHTRAVAHDLGIHLSSCTEGRRIGDSRRDWHDEDHN